MKVNAKSWKTNYYMLKSTRDKKVCVSTELRRLMKMKIHWRSFNPSWSSSVESNQAYNFSVCTGLENPVEMIALERLLLGSLDMVIEN